MVRGWDEDIDCYCPWVPTVSPGYRCSGIWWYGQQSSGQPRIIICGLCSSSNLVAWSLFQQGCLDPWDSVLGVAQWAGQGQMGRVWHSPEGNIYASCLLPDNGFKNFFFPSVFFGFLAVKALCSLGVQVWLKWPNDIIYRGAKLGGMLVQERGDRSILGLGINVLFPPLRADLGQGAGIEPGYLNPSPYPDWGPLRWWATLVNQMIVWYEKVVLWDMQTIRLCIEGCLAFKDKEVWVFSNYSLPYIARLKGIDNLGRLRICRAGHRESLQQGRIVIKDKSYLSWY